MANYDFSFYDWSADVLRTMSEKVLKQNYRHLRTVAQKRIKRLAENEHARQSEFYSRWARGFATATELKRKSDLVYELSNVMRFLSATSSTISGQKKIRREKIKTLQEHGYDVTEKNFDAFIKMVQDAKEDKSKYDELQFKEEWNDAEIRALKMAEIE